jgi:hypothetical protein
MSVIAGSSVSVKTMADGTLRLTIDVEPRDAQAAFALFGSPGRAIALAALVDGAGAIPDAVIPASEKPKGGEWAKLAGMWCNDPDFWLWANSTTHNGIFWNVLIETDAADFVRELCDIRTRADLDHDPAALARFNELIRYPFMKWMVARGISK